MWQIWQFFYGKICQFLWQNLSKFRISNGNFLRCQGNVQESEEGPRSRPSSRESKSSDSRRSPKGSPVSGKGLRKENIGRDIKREDVGVIDRKSERESDTEYARFRFMGGLKELARIASTTREAVVAVARRVTPGPGLDKALLLDMGVPKDSIEKVMQIYLSSYGHFLTRDDGKEKSQHRRHRTSWDTEGELKHSSRRHSDVQEHKEHRREKGERVNRSSKGYVSSQEDLWGYRGSRRADRDVRGRDLPVWTDATLKNLSYDGSTEWETFIHRFRLIADQMGLNDREKAEFLVSTLQGDSSKAIMRAQRIRGELSFKDIYAVGWRVDTRGISVLQPRPGQNWARLFNNAKNHSSIGPTG